VNNRVVLFLNGEIPNQFPDLSLYDKIYCTDGSFNYLKKNNITPDVITGDFDSIEQSDLPKDIQLIHTPDQEFTDFEKVLQIITENNSKSVDVFGASGKEQDHFLGNLNVAYKYKEQIEIIFFDNYSKYFFTDKDTKLSNVLGQTISLFPFPSCKGITTKGLEFPLFQEDLNLLDRIGTRNKAIENTIEIDYKVGELILFILTS